MRRTTAFIVLMTLAVVSFGCGNCSDRSGAANSNSPGTTTYSNSSAPQPTTSAPSAGGTSVGGTAPKATPTAPGIKPPTDK
jgi:hypothetical protein